MDNGLKAVEAFKQGCFDAAVLDLNMPGVFSSTPQAALPQRTSISCSGISPDLL